VLIGDSVQTNRIVEQCGTMAKSYTIDFLVSLDAAWDATAPHVCMHACVRMRCSAWVAAREANRMVESDASMPKMIPIEKTCQISH
jgi:hypothetical protein